jgi:hypothetical protein
MNELSNNRVLSKFLPDCSGVSSNDVQYSRRYARAFSENGQSKSRKWSSLRRLDDDRAASCKCRPNLSREHRCGKIPRCDCGANAHGLIRYEYPFVRCSTWNGVAVNPPRFFCKPLKERCCIRDFTLSLCCWLALLTRENYREVIAVRLRARPQSLDQ